MLATLVIPGHTETKFFDNNPNSEDKIPLIAKVVPTVPVDEAARTIADGIESRKQVIVYPFLLQLMAFAHSWVPSLVEYVVNVTGWKH